MKFRFINGLAAGLVIGFLISTLSLWLIDGTKGVVHEFFSQHLTHFFTIFAAGFALWGISRQIQSNFELAERTRLAKLEAARSSLPIVLSNIHKICEARYNALARGEKSPPNPQHWELSEFDLSTLQSCIEHADGIPKERMQEIIRIYQVLISRWEDLDLVNLFEVQDLKADEVDIIQRSSQISAVFDWVALRKISDSLFPYSRGETDVRDKQSIKDSIFQAIGRINDGSVNGQGGYLLTNKRNFNDFLLQRQKENYVPFLDRGWR